MLESVVPLLLGVVSVAGSIDVAVTFEEVTGLVVATVLPVVVVVVVLVVVVVGLGVVVLLVVSVVTGFGGSLFSSVPTTMPHQTVDISTVPKVFISPTR